jgi:hypothetical protein
MDRSISISTILLLAIALALWCIFLWGVNVTA